MFFAIDFSNQISYLIIFGYLYYFYHEFRSKRIPSIACSIVTLLIAFIPHSLFAMGPPINDAMSRYYVVTAFVWIFLSAKGIDYFTTCFLSINTYKRYFLLVFGIIICFFSIFHIILQLNNRLLYQEEYHFLKHCLPEKGIIFTLGHRDQSFDVSLANPNVLIELSYPYLTWINLLPPIEDARKQIDSILTKSERIFFYFNPIINQNIKLSSSYKNNYFIINQIEELKNLSNFIISHYPLKLIYLKKVSAYTFNDLKFENDITDLVFYELDNHDLK